MLDTSQQAAVNKISNLSSRIYILTGAGGSGKTFTIQHLLTKLWNSSDNNISRETTYLAASTGKAAKIINDAFQLSGFEIENPAKTIHRLLQYNPGMGWGYNEFNKLDASLVILDESSMADSLLLSRVINALPDYCYLLLVGDKNQLAPVAPGQPFTDLVTLGAADVVNELKTNHRQAQGSLIAHACLSILDGKKPTWGTKGENTLGGELKDDLFFVESDDKEEIPLIVYKLCKEWDEYGMDYVVLAPQKTGVCGVDNLNKFLQAMLNPPMMDKAEIKVAWLTLRVGDKVLQTKNNYELDVFNGFTGLVLSIDPVEKIVVVVFDGQIVTYATTENIQQLVLGYAMSIHRSQGSQFKYGVVVCHSSHYYMQSRSLFYTAVSRFKQELYIVGDNKAIKRALSNVVSGERNTHLKLVLSSKNTL